MASPVEAYKTIRFVWNESKPLRDWLWSKLPSVQDRKKREAVEAQLQSLLDDSNDLAKALPESQLDEKISQRIDRFRLDLANTGIEPQEIDLLAERAALFVRMLVTGPLADIVSLRARLVILESELANSEKQRLELLNRLSKVERQVSDLQETQKEAQGQQSMGLVGLLVVFILLAAYYLANR